MPPHSFSFEMLRWIICIIGRCLLACGWLSVATGYSEILGSKAMIWSGSWWARFIERSSVSQKFSFIVNFTSCLNMKFSVRKSKIAVKMEIKKLYHRSNALNHSFLKMELLFVFRGAKRKWESLGTTRK